MFSALLLLLSIRQKLSLGDEPTGVYRNKVDHNDPSRGTFAQRYFSKYDFVDNNKYKYAIVYIGGEGTLAGASGTQGAYDELARRLRAPVFGLEHRFYGKSMPFGELSSDNLRFLSLEQAMADMASFIRDVVLGSEMAAADTRVLIVGGSYAGAFSSWFRMKYPRFAFASWASSGPVIIKNEFPEYDEYIALQLNRTDASCLSNTKEVLQQLQDIVASGDEQGIQKLRDDFGFTADQDVVSMLYCVTDVISAMVQYDTKIKLLGEFCAAQKSGPDYDALVVSIKKVLAALKETIQDFDLLLQTDVNAAGPYANGRSWSYQTCTEFGWFQTASGSFRPSWINISYFNKVCKNLFGIEELADNEEMNTKYESDNPQQTRVFFTRGDVDPWSVLTVKNPDEYLMRRAINIEGASHCADLHPISENDSEQLSEAKQIVIDQLYSWLTEEDCSGKCVNGKCAFGGCVCDAGYGGKYCETEIKSKRSFDILLICSISIPVLILVIIIFTVWIVDQSKKRKMIRL